MSHPVYVVHVYFASQVFFNKFYRGGSSDKSCLQDFGYVNAYDDSDDAESALYSLFDLFFNY